MISWSICAASRRRRSRRSPVPGASMSNTSRRFWRNRPRHGALSCVAAAASARSPPPTGCARAASTIWLWWHWVSPRRVVMTLHTTDKNVLGHIEELVTEEKKLYAQGEISDAERERLAKINVELDRCWDLLRQRRALAEYGRNSDEAEVRSAKVVENYKG